ncbi:MAG TPA: ABC transporter permease [Chloroflexia bacterium]|nr:ABC transporter permease [Chloroflexia bacterium]
MVTLKSTFRTLLPPAIALALILAAWEAYSRLVLGGVPGGERLLPAPTRIAGALYSNLGILAPHTWQTLLETAIGFALALLLGFSFAVLIDLSPLLRAAIYPLLVVSQTIPLLAIAPLMVLWFGFGLLPKVLIVALVCFFPIVVAGADGFRSTDPELVRLFRTFGAGRWEIFRYVRFPGALPSLFSGVRIAITYSVIGAVWGEYVGAQWGLGIFMQRAQHSYQVALVFAAILVISALSIGLFVLVSLAERLAIPWYFASRKTKDFEPVVEPPALSIRAQERPATERAIGGKNT